MNTINKKTGRRPGKSITKDKIITIAQELFTKTNYEQTSIRNIAKLAEVDPSLVLHFFNSKQELFIEAMTPSQNMPQKIAKALEGDTETCGIRVTTLFVDMLEAQATNRVILSIVRAVIQVPAAASLLKVLLIRPILNTFKNSEKLDNAELRATLVESQLMGIIMSRYILKIEPLASLPSDQLISYLAPTIQRYLMDNLSFKNVNG